MDMGVIKKENRSRGGRGEHQNGFLIATVNPYGHDSAVLAVSSRACVRGKGCVGWETGQ